MIIVMVCVCVCDLVWYGIVSYCIDMVWIWESECMNTIWGDRLRLPWMGPPKEPT